MKIAQVVKLMIVSALVTACTLQLREKHIVEDSPAAAQALDIMKHADWVCFETQEFGARSITLAHCISKDGSEFLVTRTLPTRS